MSYKRANMSIYQNLSRKKVNFWKNRTVKFPTILFISIICVPKPMVKFLKTVPLRTLALICLEKLEPCASLCAEIHVQNSQVRSFILMFNVIKCKK